MIFFLVCLKTEILGTGAQKPQGLRDVYREVHTAASRAEGIKGLSRSVIFK